MSRLIHEHEVGRRRGVDLEQQGAPVAPGARRVRHPGRETDGVTSIEAERTPRVAQGDGAAEHDVDVLAQRVQMEMAGRAAGVQFDQVNIEIGSVSRSEQRRLPAAVAGQVFAAALTAAHHLD